MLKKNVAKISLILLLILVILFYSASFVLARDNYAIGIATVDDEGGFLWDTKNSISQVIGAYSRAGYRVYGVANPGKQHLWEQLYADVQCFLCHGNKDCVVTAISGIIIWTVHEKISLHKSVFTYILCRNAQNCSKDKKIVPKIYRCETE